MEEYLKKRALEYLADMIDDNVDDVAE